jgi:hypothetical protein
VQKNYLREGKGRYEGGKKGVGGKKLKFYFKLILNPTKHNSFSIIITSIFFHLEYEKKIH